MVVIGGGKASGFVFFLGTQYVVLKSYYGVIHWCDTFRNIGEITSQYQ